VAPRTGLDEKRKFLPLQGLKLQHLRHPPHSQYQLHWGKFIETLCWLSQFIMPCESLHFFLCVDSENAVLMESSEILWQDVFEIYAGIRIFSVQGETKFTHKLPIVWLLVKNTSWKCYTAYAPSWLVFKIHVAIKWSAALLTSAVVMIHSTQDMKCTAGVSCDWMTAEYTQDKYCDMLFNPWYL
jgi:hypothetical protein